ncbi:MAG: 2-oxoacid:acceptor oxidoreductase family protein [Candidatus Riflebacteria bacterium]|nr:2-oxoacid:acceptor oxidoreductase family protein [Candidatus Riflebacteria bacterium]
MSLEIEKVVVAGHAFDGIDILGHILARAGMLSGRHVSWLPPHGPVIMAGNAHGTVIVSSAQVGSPVVEVPDALIALNLHAFDSFNGRLKAGGLLVYDSTRVRAEESQFRDDIRSIGVPVAELAPAEPGLVTPSMALLGAFVACSKLLNLEVGLDALRDVLRLEGAPAGADLRVNRRAMERGASYVKERRYMFSRYRYAIFTG